MTLNDLQTKVKVIRFGTNQFLMTHCLATIHSALMTATDDDRQTDGRNTVAVA